MTLEEWRHVGWPWLDLLLVLSMIAAVVMLVFLLRTLPRAEHATSRATKKIAEMRWYVSEIKELNGWVVVALNSQGMPRREIVIPFRPRHPDIEHLKKLGRLDLIEFTALDHKDGLECALPMELCAYLRLKNAEPWAT